MVRHVCSKMDPYTAVRKWTQKIDLFSKKFVVVPINEQYVQAIT